MGTEVSVVAPKNNKITRKYHSVFDSYLPRRPVCDGQGAFLQSELELIDPQLHAPLAWVTYPQDAVNRQGFNIDVEFASWTNSNFGSNGGSNGGKNWIGMESNDQEEIAVSIEKQVNVPGIWSKAASWTFPELSRSAKLGRPIDVDKLDAIQRDYNLQVDNQFYLGDPSKKLFGIANASAADGNTADWAVTQNANLVTGGWLALIASNPTTAGDIILADLAALDQQVWANSSYTSPATKFLIPSSVWRCLIVPLAISGVPIAMSVKDYFETTGSISASMGGPCRLAPRKWLNHVLTGNGFGNTLSTNRIVAYNDSEEYIRFEQGPLIATPVEVRGIRQKVTYYGALGGIEILYPSTVGYGNGA